MRRFIRALALYGKPFYLISVICIIAFQSFWLYQTFLHQRFKLLQQTEVAMQQIMIGLDVQQLTKLGGSVQVSDRNTPRSARPAVSIQTVIVDKFDSSGPAVAQKVADELRSLIGTAAHDSLLYNALQNAMPALADNSGLAIYRRDGTTLKVFPRGRPPLDFHNTTLVRSGFDDRTTYQAHIGHLNRIVLRNMIGTLAISVLYLLLFIGTIGLLVYTAKLNKALLESKRTFTRNMTHELKIPITTISVAAEAMVKYEAAANPTDARRYAGMIQRAAEQLSIMVEKILSHAMANEKQLSLQRTCVPLKVLLQEVVHALQPLLLKQSASIDLRHLPGRISLLADYDQMRHVFLNLLDNALKYSTKAPVVVISAEEIGRQVSITMADNGNGIPKAHLDDVFQPYFRIDPGDVHEVKGFGLGLSYVREIVQLHGGSIRVAASSSEGTTIELKLPVYEG